MNQYQTQQLVGFASQMMKVMMLGGIVRAPVLMLQTVNKDYEKEKELTACYGSWAAGLAKARCPRGDWECREREASRLAAVSRERFGQTPGRYYINYSVTLSRLSVVEQNVPGARVALMYIHDHPGATCEEVHIAALGSSIVRDILDELEMGNWLVRR